MESIYSRVELWVRDQTAKMAVYWSPPASPRWHWPLWPPWKGRHDRREQERLLRQEYERQRRQLHDLCRAAKAESIVDLQEILCSMVLAECVYKRPATEMMRAINKFKSDFGGQLVSLERVQYSLDHVPHRYLLAEAGDTLFASFIGTKQYKDVITDANIFQGAIFPEGDEEDLETIDVMENDRVDSQPKIEETIVKCSKGKPKKLQKNAKPAAHRGFLARAKGIPALEIYRLAQKKNRKLVLCGHSLGGAVAALATLAILRVLASSSVSQEHGKVQVKCITFSQPPVGNDALKDYVYQKGWQKYFKSYCIPEDLVPRILSPAYFHHYNAQTLQATTDAALVDASAVNSVNSTAKLQTLKSKDTSGEQLVLGLGPVQKPFWRLSKLVPLEGVRKHLRMLRGVGSEDGNTSSIVGHSSTSLFDEAEVGPQSLEIQEGADGISLKPISHTETMSPEGNSKPFNGKSGVGSGDGGRWKRVPYLPSYVPFGQLFLLRNSSVELLSDAEYTKLISVSSVISELKERLQSHSMRSYRFRFHKIYEQFMCINAASFLGIEQLPQFPHLQQLLGLRAAGAVELGHIVDPPIVRTATSILPLGWSGIPGNNNAEPLKVDIIGHGLHMCTLFQAQVNGKWCSTVVETLPSMPSYSSNLFAQPDLQKMRILIGTPLKRPPKYPVEEHLSLFSYPSAESIDIKPDEKSKFSSTEGLAGFVVYCTSDFISVPKRVYVRVRRVRLLGLEGAGKTSLLKAVSDQSNRRDFGNVEWVQPEESFIDGLCYLDSAGVKFKELDSQARKLREELQEGTHDLIKKIDLVVLVHNLSQQIPLHGLQSSNSSSQPALSALLNEVKTLGTPWVLAITNKFSVSSREQKVLARSVMEAYETPPAMAEVVNSCPFVVPIASTSTRPVNTIESNITRRLSALKLILAPINLARIPFQRKDIIFPIEGVAAFRKLVHHVLHSHEEMAFQELANERLSVELARERKMAVEAAAVSQEKGSSITAAAVGASLGAGLGLIMAVVMGAASALRKP